MREAILFKKRTVLFAPTKFVNDLKDRFYNCVAKSLANPILHSASGDGHRFRHGEDYIPFLNVNHPENSQYEKLRGKDGRRGAGRPATPSAQSAKQKSLISAPSSLAPRAVAQQVPTISA